MKTSRVSKLVVVIDDDPLVLEATSGLLRSWGCRVVAGESYADAMTKLIEIGQRPDLIVCDYRLPGPTGVDAIEMLRDAFEIPALLISGDAASPQSDDGAGGSGHVQEGVHHSGRAAPRRRRHGRNMPVRGP